MATNFSQRRTHPLRAIAAALLPGVAAAFPSSAQQLPTGGSVAAGNVSIGAPQHGTLNINQSTNQAIINWNTFSVGAGGTVNFNQPGAASATLNRVTSSTPSSIAGTINAPGTVMLVNPNGIAITKSGVINTGSFVASTLAIKNEDFLAGKYNFQGNGASAPVTNRGHINVSTGGFVALLGGRVSNSGVINAKLGKVGLGSGEMATIDLSGDGFMSVAVPSNQVQNLRDGQGRALVSNSGKINANGGTVVLSAATAKNAFQQAVNVPGSIRANSVGVRAGKIVLNGGDGGIVNVGGTLAANGGKRGNGGSITVAGAKISVPGKIAANGQNGGHIAVTAAGNLSVAGRVSARGRAAEGGRIDLAGAKISVPGKIAASGQKGGQIAVTSTGNLSVAGKVSAKGRAGEGGRIDLAGKDIALTGAKVNASGATGGGLVRVGGAFQGGKADQSDPLYQSYVARWGALPPIAAATTVTIDAGTRINVSARHAGDGGTAIVWSEQTTGFAGSILARGGALGGDGGSVETSGRVNLQATGIVDAAASHGAAGQWLLDPNNITIQSAGSNTNVTASPNFTSTDDNAIVTTTSIQAALNAGTSVTVTTASAGSNTQAGDITVANAIAKTAGGNATLTLNASHDITFNAGANITSTTGALGLTLNAAGNINTLQNVSLNGGTLTLNATGNGTQSGVISGNTSVLMSGAGTFTLSSTNTYTGVTTINAGVLSVATIGNGGSAGNLGAATSAATNLVLGGGTLQYTGATASTNRAFTLTAGTTSSIDVTTNTLTISGAGANTTGSLTKIGAGTLTLSGANAYTGTTTISAGTLTLGASNVLATGSTVVVNGGTFSINTRSNTVAGVQLASGSITGTTGVLTSTTAYDVQSGTVSAILAGGVGLNKTTSGTVTLSGNNTYTGATTISAGTLQIGSGGTVGSVAGDIVNNAALTFNRSNALTYAGVISGTGTVTKSGAGTLTLTGDSTYSGTTTISAGTLQIGSGGTTGSVTSDIVDNAALTFNRSDALTYAGVISGTGTVTKSGTGTLTLTGNSTYSGTTTISANGGTLQAGTTNAFSANSAYTLNTGTTLDLGGFNQTIGSLASAGGAGTVTNTGGAAATLTTGATASTTFSGTIQDGSPAATIGLTKQGTGTFTLTGDSTYTGGTTISAGTLQIGSGGTTGSVAGDIVDNAALTFNRSNALTYAGVITGTGTVTKSGAGTLTLTGDSTYTGATTISAGTLQLGNGGTTGSVAGNVVDNAAVVINRSDTLTYAGVISGTGTLTQAGTGTTILTGANTYTGTTTISTGTLQIGNGGTTGSVAGNIANNTTLVFNRSNTLTYSGVVSGTGALTQAGSGTLILTGANTYTGGTTISAGTLQIGSGGTVGSIAGDIVNNAALTFNRSNALTYAGVISGTGTVTKSGAGTLTLTADNTYAGGTTINAGTLAVSTDAKLGAASGGLSFGGGTLRFDASFTSNRGVTLNAGGGTFNTNGNSSTLSGTITGAGGLTKSGGGTLTLTGTNDYQGNTTISGGTLGVSSDVNLGAATGILSVRGGGTLQFLANLTSGRNVTIGPGNAIFDTNGHDATLGGAITGGSSSTELHKIGAGTLMLTGNNTYTGQLQINAGTLILTGDNQPSITSTPINSGATLQIGNGGATGSLTGNVTNDGFFIINRSNAYTFGGVISGTGSFVQMGAGTTTLTATNTYTGTTTIAAGTLNANASAALGDGSATNTLIFTGGTLQAGGTITSPSTRGVTLTSTGIIDTNGNSVSIAGVISGSGDLTKNGIGTLTLSGANTYTGATTIAAGTLAAQNAAALGTTDAGTTVTAGATLQIADGVAIGAETLTLSGAGVGSNGALVVTSGSASFGGAITLGTSASIGGNGSLTLGGTVNDISAGTSMLTQVGSGTLTFSNTVGATNALAAVTTSAGQTTAVNGGSVRTTGDQVYGGSVTTSGATTLTSTGGDITVSNAVNWSNSSLTLVAGRNIAINATMSGGAAGDLTALANGNLTIGATGSISGKTIALAASGAFTNNRGSDAVSASDRWLVYSSAPNAPGQNFGNLNSNNTAIWGNTYATLPPASVTLPGNRYIFATPATLTVTSLNDSKTYGSTANLSLYTVTGFQAGVPNAFLGDPTTVSGTPGFFSVGTPATANVGTNAIIVSQGTLSATNGYTFAFNSSGLLTVNPQALTITADSATQTYSNVPYSGGNGVTYTGFVNGENSSVLGGTITFGGNSQGAVNVGTYTIIPSGLSSSNYKINYVDGTLTINPAPINPAPINPAPINPAPINPAPIAVGNLDTLAIIANAAGTTSPSLVMNTTVLPTSPGNVMLFSGNTVLPYGDDAGPAGGSTNQQTSDVSVDLKRRRIIVRTR